MGAPDPTLALIGERGPELIWFPRGQRIETDRDEAGG